MTDTKRFRYDPNSPLQRRADALALARERFHADLVKARRDADLTQQDVADRLGLSQPTVATFERYDNDPRLSTIIRYAHGVGVLVDFKVTPDTGQLAKAGEWSRFRTFEPHVQAEGDRAAILRRLETHGYANVRSDFGTAA